MFGAFVTAESNVGGIVGGIVGGVAGLGVLVGAVWWYLRRRRSHGPGGDHLKVMSSSHSPPPQSPTSGSRRHSMGGKQGYMQGSHNTPPETTSNSMNVSVIVDGMGRTNGGSTGTGAGTGKGGPREGVQQIQPRSGPVGSSTSVSGVGGSGMRTDTSFLPSDTIPGLIPGVSASFVRNVSRKPGLSQPVPSLKGGQAA